MTKILVVDDDARMVRLLTATLPDTYEMLQAQDGEEGVATAESESPDLILLDINMPGLNGFEALRKIRQMNHLGNTKVILVTARSDDADQRLGSVADALNTTGVPTSPL